MTTDSHDLEGIAADIADAATDLNAAVDSVLKAEKGSQARATFADDGLACLDDLEGFIADARAALEGLS